MTKIVYDVPWNGGRVQVEVETLKELEQISEELQSMNLPIKTVMKADASNTMYPSLSGTLTCRQAILELLSSDWGRKDLRTESELTAAMQANALYFPHGTISSQLTIMKRKQEIHRPSKKNGSWAYVIAVNGMKNSEHHEILVTA